MSAEAREGAGDPKALLQEALDLLRDCRPHIDLSADNQQRWRDRRDAFVDDAFDYIHVPTDRREG